MIGTTPELTFNLPFDTSIIKNLYITFKDRNKSTVLEKTETDCTMNNNSITVELSQEETLQFEKRTKVRVQLRIKTTNDKALKSNIIVIDIGDLLKEGVI